MQPREESVHAALAPFYHLNGHAVHARCAAVRITRYSGNSSTDESIAMDIIRKKQTVVRNLRHTSTADRKQQWERQFHSFLLSAIPKLGIRNFAVADLERILKDRGIQGVALSAQMAAVFFERAMRFILSEAGKRRRRRKRFSARKPPNAYTLKIRP